MDAISYTAVRANLSKTMEKVCNDHAPIIITRKRESPVVMLSLEDYQAMEETAYLLRSLLMQGICLNQLQHLKREKV